MVFVIAAVLLVFFLRDFELTLVRAVEPWSAAHGNEQKSIRFLSGRAIDTNEVVFSMSDLGEVLCKLFEILR